MPRKMSSISRRICVSRCSRPRRTSVPGIVTSMPASAASSWASRTRAASRAATASSSFARIPFRSIPLSRSRTPRSAWASSDLRPRYLTRASSSSCSESAAPTALTASVSYAVQFTAARLSKVPPSFRWGSIGPRYGEGALASAPVCAPGLHKQRRRQRLHGYKDTHVSAYDNIARLYDPWSRSVVEDIAFYVEEATRSGGPVLELGVGTGRVAIPVAAAGIRVVGVDLSEGMLQVARERAELAGVEVDLRRGDMRDPPVEGEFPLVLIPFRSLLHMETDRDRRVALRAIAKHLEPTGRLIFDVFAPGA